MVEEITSDTRAAVVTTRKWQARDSGEELARTLQERLQTDPDFVVLFSTIHYQKYGGLQELLSGIYSVLPNHIPLIGGTVRGFANNDGCFTRGASVLGVSKKDMDIAVGIGHNTKRNPMKAAEKCASMIQEGIGTSPYQNGFVLNIISGAEIPNIQPIGTKKIIEPGTAPKTLMKLLSFSQKTLQMGASRDEEIIEGMVSHLPEYSMISGATIDDGPGFENYQFYNQEVLKNSMVSLGMKSNNRYYVKSTHNMKKTDIHFDITKVSKDYRIIHEINGKPALQEWLRLLNWPKELLNEETWLKTTFYFPIGGKCLDQSIDDNTPHIIGIILGESLLLTCKIINTHGSILTIDGKRLLQAIDDNLSTLTVDPLFGLMASCTTRLETLGNKVFSARDKVDSYMNGKPFMMFYVGGESTYSPQLGLDYSNMSFNSSIMGT